MQRTPYERISRRLYFRSGFRGTDQFVIEFNYGHGPDTDHFTVNVQ